MAVTPAAAGAPGGPPVVLALRALGLGDMLTGIPALRGLRRAYPDARLALAAPPGLGDWLVRQGVVDASVPAAAMQPIPWAGTPPEVAVNLHGRGPQSHRLLQQLSPGRLVAFACPEAGHPADPADESFACAGVVQEWNADEHEVDRWCRLVGTTGGVCGPEDLRLTPPGRPPAGDPAGRHSGDHAGDDATRCVVVHPGAASGSRRWPADRWREVAATLAADGHRVVVTGTDAERQLCAAVASGHPGVDDYCGRHDLDGLARVVGHASLLLCGDTGVAHLGTAYGTPSVLLFGPTPPAGWGPRIDVDRHHVLWHPEPADPPGDPHAGAVDVRLARIGAAEVLDHAAMLLRIR